VRTSSPACCKWSSRSASKSRSHAKGPRPMRTLGLGTRRLSSCTMPLCEHAGEWLSIVTRC